MTNGIYIKLSTEHDSAYRELWQEYGVRLLRGAYEALLTPTGMKDYVTNESRLAHGTEYAAHARYAKQKERKVGLSVVLEAVDYDHYLAQYEAFMELLTSGMVWLKVTRLNRVFKLVYTECSKFSFGEYRKATFTLEFVEPNPTDRPAITNDEAEE